MIFLTTQKSHFCCIAQLYSAGKRRYPSDFLVWDGYGNCLSIANKPITKYSSHFVNVAGENDILKLLCGLSLFNIILDLTFSLVTDHHLALGQQAQLMNCKRLPER